LVILAILVTPDLKIRLNVTKDVTKKAGFYKLLLILLTHKKTRKPYFNWDFGFFLVLPKPVYGADGETRTPTA
tara:strand:- start:1160 stop:1378 length:219 start_codon:yes stop_codon:yes gene_type:complete